MRRELGDLVDLAGLPPEQAASLRRVHELLVGAGPPEELPVALLQPPQAPALGTVVQLRPRRRPTVALLIAASVAVVCFGSGYLLANQAHQSATGVARVVSLQGGARQQDSFASLRVGSADSDGNWPIQLTVTGLPQLSGAQSRYFLMLWENGKPSSLCGIFEVGKSGPTTVSFSVPYPITASTRFVVTKMAPGVQFPGHVVMTSS